MSNSKLASGAPLVNTLPKQSLLSPQSPQDLHAFERASIDVPRIISPFSISRGSIPLGESREPELRDRSNGSALRRRPTSMSSLLLPHSHPTDIADSPLSPPKPLLLTATQGFSRHLPERSLESIESRSYSPIGFHTPTKHLLSGPLTPVSDIHSPAGNGIVRQDSVQKENVRGAAYGSATQNNPPTATKRTEKPKVPKKPTTVKNKETSLVSNINRSSKGIISFDTPSSRDESLETDLNNSHAVYDPRFFPRNLVENTGNNHLRLPIHSSARKDQSTKSGESRSDELSVSLVHRSDFRSHVSPNSSAQSRPGLPPRREVSSRLQQFPMPALAPRLIRTWSEQSENQKSMRLQTQPSIPSGHSRRLSNAKISSLEFMPPPKRAQSSVGHDPNKIEPRISSQTYESLSPDLDMAETKRTSLYSELDANKMRQLSEYPDTSSVNRMAPVSAQGVQRIYTHYDTKIFDMSDRYICTTGYLTKAWDITSGEIIMNISHGEKEVRATAIAFKQGLVAEEEGVYIWLGTNYGDLLEVNISTQTVLYTKSAAHNRREIIKIFRCQKSMWTLDDDGKLYVWPPDDQGLPNLRSIPHFRKIPRKHSFSLIIQNQLWLATGKDIRIFHPDCTDDADFQINSEPLNQPGVGEITSGAVIPGKLQLVYFGHADGKVTAYSTVDFTCLGVFNISAYKINSLAGAGTYLWAGYSTGVISVYNTETQPWSTKKEWQAHNNPVISILTHTDNRWRTGLLRVASIGTDNAVMIWDGLLEHDWLGMH